ncbi:ankyrin repeat-containing domain protein [Phyllosticta citricarpa]
MQALCDDCSKQATKLLVKMNQLQGEKELTLKNVPKAMKLVWKKDELDTTVRLLESYQARINTRLLIEMRTEETCSLSQPSSGTSKHAQHSSKPAPPSTPSPSNASLPSSPPAQAATRASSHCSSRAALGEAASHGHVAAVNALLDRGANAMHGSAFHPLLRATAGGHVAVMRLLLDRGRVNINQRSWQQKTALIEASVMRRYQPAKLLVDRGADLRMRDEFGKSAFFWAVVHNDLPLVELLLRRDAEGVLSLKDKLGVSPRGIAVQNGHQHMARFLEERGAVL